MEAMTKGVDIKNVGDLSESQVFEKAREQLNPIQENLIEKKITIDEARSELKKINEWIQWTKLENKDKKEIWKVFEKLTKLEEDVDKNALKDEVAEVMKLLEKLTQKDLANLKQGIKQSKWQWNSERPVEIQQWIQESSDNLASTIHDASQDKNPIARKVGERMEKLMS